MSAWVVAPCLEVLLGEYNKVSSGRDRGADGTVGDVNHSPSSDHSPDEDSPVLRGKDTDHINEVHALDVDSTGPWPDGKRGDIAGSWFDQKIHMIIGTEKKRWEDPNDMCRLNYIIWRGMIYDKDNDWVGKTYTATSDKHFDHVHFSARYETRAENDIRSWNVYVAPEPEEDDMPTPADLWNYQVPNPYNDNKPQSVAGLLSYIGSRQGISDEVGKEVAPQFVALEAKVEALEAKVDQVLSLLQASNE